MAGFTFSGGPVLEPTEFKDPLETQSLESDKPQNPKFESIVKQAVQQEFKAKERAGSEEGAGSIRGRPSWPQTGEGAVLDIMQNMGKQNLNASVPGKEPLKKVVDLAKSTSWIAAARARLIAASTSASKESKRRKISGGGGQLWDRNRWQWGDR